MPTTDKRGARHLPRERWTLLHRSRFSEDWQDQLARIRSTEPDWEGLDRLLGFGDPEALRSHGEAPNYRRFALPKKSRAARVDDAAMRRAGESGPHRSGRGAESRAIMAPDEGLGLIQRRVYDVLAPRIPVRSIVHGFVRGRSPLTNAVVHVGAGVVASVDIRNFFGSVTELHVAESLARQAPWISAGVRAAIVQLTTVDVRFDRERDPLIGAIAADRLMAAHRRFRDDPAHAVAAHAYLRGESTAALSWIPPRDHGRFAEFVARLGRAPCEALSYALTLHLVAARIAEPERLRRSWRLDALVAECITDLGLDPLPDYSRASLETIAHRAQRSLFDAKPPPRPGTYRRPDSRPWTAGDAEAGETLRALPQGAPSSPLLANLAADGLDSDILALCRAVGLQYTRYADDLTFSGAEIPQGFVGNIARLLERHGFILARHKTRRRTRANRQLVTGLVVNERPRPPRDYLRWLRSALHRLEVGRAPTYFPPTRKATDEPLPRIGRGRLRGHLAWVRQTSPPDWLKLRRRYPWIEDEEWP